MLLIQIRSFEELKILIYDMASYMTSHFSLYENRNNMLRHIAMPQKSDINAQTPLFLSNAA